MDYSEYKKIIISETEKLSQQEKVALCLICCERLSPLYAKFQNTENWGNVTILNNIRERAVAWLEGAKQDFADLHEQLDRNIPDMDDFGSLLSSFALNAGVSHLNLIYQIQSNDSHHINDALQMCYDTVDFCVQHDLDPDFTASVSESQIENHDMMILETEWQLDEIRRIKGLKDFSKFLEGNIGESRIFDFIADIIERS